MLHARDLFSIGISSEIEENGATILEAGLEGSSDARKRGPWGQHPHSLSSSATTKKALRAFFFFFFFFETGGSNHPSQAIILHSLIETFASRFTLTHPGVWRASPGARLALAIRDGASSKGAEEEARDATPVAVAVAAAVEIGDDDDDAKAAIAVGLDAALLVAANIAAGVATGAERRIVEAGKAAARTSSAELL